MGDGGAANAPNEQATIVGVKVTDETYAVSSQALLNVKSRG